MTSLAYMSLILRRDLHLVMCLILVFKRRRKNRSPSSTVRQCAQRGRLHGSASCCFEWMF